MPALKGRLAKLKDLGLRPASRLTENAIRQREERQPAGFLEGWDRIAPGLHIRTAETGFSLPSSAVRSFDPGLFRASNLHAAGQGTPSALRTPGWEDVSFFDLETTGLSGGTGTIAFLAAIGFFSGDSLLVTQAFIDDFPAEPAFLEFVIGFLSERPFLVTYNGASFDLPLLRTRCIMNGLRIPDFGHLDALHPARRLWKRSLGSCSLQDLEAGLFGDPRWNDVPGFLIPRLWLDFSATSASAASDPAMNDIRMKALPEMARIAEHNALDVKSLARLAVRMSGILADPCSHWEKERTDPVRLALLLLRQDRRREALDLLEEAGISGDRDALRLAAMLYRRAKNLEACARLAAQMRPGSIPEYLELAKFHEHLAKDFQAALSCTEAAIALAGEQSDSRFSGQSGVVLMGNLVRRRARLSRKLSRISGQPT